MKSVQKLTFLMHNSGSFADRDTGELIKWSKATVYEEVEIMPDGRTGVLVSEYRCGPECDALLKTRGNELAGKELKFEVETVAVGKSSRTTLLRVVS